jgi:hypothetical protein
MSDFKFYPSALPRALQTGYSIKHKANMLRTQMSDGYVRQRLVNQGAPDTLSVQMIMTELEYRTLIEWYKADIQCGASWFVMPVLSVDSDQHIQYRYVRIQNGEISASVVSTNPTEGTIYRVSMTLDVSNTVVDDGTWHDGGQTAAGDDETGEVTIVDSARIISDVDDLGDSSGTYTIVEE